MHNPLQTARSQTAFPNSNRALFAEKWQSLTPDDKLVLRFIHEEGGQTVYEEQIINALSARFAAEHNGQYSALSDCLVRLRQAGFTSEGTEDYKTHFSIKSAFRFRIQYELAQNPWPSTGAGVHPSDRNLLVDCAGLELEGIQIQVHGYSDVLDGLVL